MKSLVSSDISNEGIQKVLDCLGEPEAPEALAAMLRAECDAKPDSPRAIGFRP